MFRILVLVGLIFFNASVSADDYPAMPIYTFNGTEYGSLDAACSAKRNDYDTVYDEVTYSVIDAQSCEFFISLNHFSYWGPTVTYSCAGGGSLSGTQCVGASACVSPQVRSTTSGMCEAPAALPFCTGVQNPVDNDCQYNLDQLSVSCLDGSSVVPPASCPVSDWQDVFDHPKPLCSPLDTDFSQCEPLLFQRIDEWASSHALQYGLAAMLLGAPIISTALSVVEAATSVVADSVLYADYTVLSRTASGEMVDAVVRAQLPKPTFGDAVQKLIEHNPSSPYVSGLPNAINGSSGPNAPQIIRDNLTGHLKYTGSDNPVTPNQLSDITKALHNTYPIPMAEVKPYIVAENIPWLKYAEPAIKYDLLHVDAPAYFPISPISPLPVQVSTAQIIRTASPLSPYSTTTGQPPVIVAAPAEMTVRQLQPFATLTPASPMVYAPVISTPSSLPAPTTNPNPTGTDVPTPPTVPPDPNLPVNPGDSFLPPEPPTVYPDTYKFFDFLPTVNPFSWNVSNFMPQLPVTSCNYEIHETFNVPFLGVKHFDVAPCVPLEPLRQVLQWAFAVLTAISCFFIMTRATFR